jgi:Fur family peroxide stress response transcriptional regulator
MNKQLEIKNIIASKGLRVTPQRMRVLEAIYKLDNHPTAENIIDYIRKNDPNIGVGTVYHILDTLVENEIIKKVKTDKDSMRYDGIIESHHHLYCKQCDYIEDYSNEELNSLLKKFFEENKIDNFVIDDIKLNITGNFIIHKNSKH